MTEDDLNAFLESLIETRKKTKRLLEEQIESASEEELQRIYLMLFESKIKQ